MRSFRYILMVFALLCAFTLTVCADDDWYVGDWDDFEDPPQNEENDPATDATDPAGSESGEGTTEGATDGTSEGTTPEESVSEDATTEPGEQTTDPMEQQTTEMTTEQPSESETQSTEPAGGLPMPAIIAGLAVLGVACLALVVFLVIKYFRAQKQD